MPDRYAAIRDSLKSRGKSDKTAKRIAAATYNKTRKPGQAPVTGNDRRMSRSGGPKTRTASNRPRSKKRPARRGTRSLVQ